MSTNVLKSDDSSVKTVAVIDIGSTSIRMAIAEIGSGGRVRTLEKLSQSTSLGRDTFTTGTIQPSTIEDVVRILKSYSKILAEYQINEPDQIRTIATSAVREASNRLAFVDRIYIATGYAIDIIEEAEANRVTYLGIQPLLQNTELASGTVLIVEVGGGNTECLVVRNGNVVFSHAYRLGSLRLRKELETFRSPVATSRHIMEEKIKRTVAEVKQKISWHGEQVLIALGGDMRFAAGQLIPEWNPQRIGRVPTVELERLTNELLGMSEDEIVQQYHISYPDAETVGPALLVYTEMAREFNLVNVMVANTNLRDGLLKELAVGEVWAQEFQKQIIRSALDLASKYHVDVSHAKHVAALSKMLFTKLQHEHRLPEKYAMILYVAALLHEIGIFLDTRGHHKHALYIIKHSEIFGFGRKQRLLTALVARYQRKSSPLPRHADYADLHRDERVAVAKMAAMLRVAIALDESRSQRIHEVTCQREKDLMVFYVQDVNDVSLEQLAVRQNGSLFEEVFGARVFLRPQSAT